MLTRRTLRREDVGLLWSRVGGDETVSGTDETDGASIFGSG